MGQSVWWGDGGRPQILTMGGQNMASLLVGNWSKIVIYNDCHCEEVRCVKLSETQPDVAILLLNFIMRGVIMRKYKNPELPVQERVEDLLSVMTTQEKVGQLTQKMLGWEGYKILDGKVVLTDAYKEEVAFGDGLGAIYGPSRADGWNSHVTMGITADESVKVANAMQRYIVENTRLGIPLLISEETPHGHEAVESTTFPTNIGIGSTWNPDLYEEVCAVMAKEIRARGAHLGLISTLDISTDPRWGRTEECYGEDPYLAAKFCGSAVRGFQGTSAEALKNDNKIAAVVKHFCGQGATIGGHNGKATNIGPRELREVHLMGMQAAVDAGALSCMAAYNDIDGVPCHLNKELLTDILRGEMGFEGFVMSDGKGVDRFHQMAGGYGKAGALAVDAGVDMDLWNDAYRELIKATDEGSLSMESLDLAVSRILRVKFMLGLFENPYITDEQVVKVNDETSQLKALEIAREVPVLLKNDGTLPFGNDVKNIAVIGPNSDHVLNMLGDYTQWQADDKVTTVLQGIKKNAPEGAVVNYAQGCSVRGPEKDGFAEAIKIAKGADVVVMVLGGSSSREIDGEFDDNGARFISNFTSEIDCGEAVDLADIRLGGLQETLARELKVLGKPMVTVLIQGRPHAIPWFEENTEAILCGWYPGEKGGDAIGEILFGKTVPSGKISMSFPISAAQLPVYYNKKNHSNYVDMTASPLYPFGYGLSYTSFEYSDFSVSNSSLSNEDLDKGDQFEVSFTIKNTGAYDAKEIAQLYIHDIESCVTRRLKELKDFKKVLIKAGETKDITLSISKKDLIVYDYKMNPIVEPGRVKLMVGKSSDEIVFDAVVNVV